MFVFADSLPSANAAPWGPFILCMLFLTRMNTAVPYVKCSMTTWEAKLFLLVDPLTSSLAWSHAITWVAGVMGLESHCCPDCQINFILLSIIDGAHIHYLMLSFFQCIALHIDLKKMAYLWLSICLVSAASFVVRIILSELPDSNACFRVSIMI